LNLQLLMQSVPTTTKVVGSAFIYHIHTSKIFEFWKFNNE
jgi:hypothetical protein